MKIESCHIENFGRLHDISVSFEDGLNYFYKENGWGKSTLCAFLRAMFYGFSGERKKGAADERRRYHPWQGGIFGGQMTISVGGRRYMISRIFGEKRSRDVFELRDADTNRISDDFSECIGEELFLINKESFERTVFIESGDCTVTATDDIHALIGNLAEDPDDRNHFDLASSILKDQINALSPNRKTGTLSRMQDQITELTQEIKSGDGIPDCIRKREAQSARISESIQNLKRERQEITRLQEEAAAAEDRELLSRRWQNLSQTCEEALSAFEAAGKKFPDRIPDEEELAGRMTSCQALIRLSGELETLRLLPEEKNDLRQHQNPKNVPDSGRRKRSKERPVLQIFMLLLGAAAVIFAIGITVTVSLLPGMLLLFPALLMVLLGMILYVRWKKDHADNREGESGPGSESRKTNAYYESLFKRQEAARKKETEYDTLRASVVSFIQAYAFEPPAGLPAELMRQLTEIQRAVIAYQTAEAAFTAAEKEKEAFERHHNTQELNKIRPGNRPSLQELQRQKNVLDQKIEKQTGDLAFIRRETDRLREEADIREEKQESLNQLLASHERLSEKYRLLQETERFLKQAAEQLTLRYGEPVLENFRHYVSFFSEEIGDEIRMDASLTITREEYGIQRDTETQSTGWQEILGLCLRLAYVDAMYNCADSPRERPPLILDDPFLALDEKNTAAGQRLLAEVAEKYQILCLRCFSID